MFRRSPRLLLAAIGAAVAFSVTAESSPQQPSQGEVIEVYGLKLVPYATVRRTDGAYRRMLIAPDNLRSLATDTPLPDGTRILMETYYQPGRVSTVFHKQKVDGKWRYGSFSAGRPDLSTRPQASCLSCHAGAAETDFTFTLPSLRAVAQGHVPSDFTCDRGGRAPCDLRVYRKGAAP